MKAGSADVGAASAATGADAGNDADPFGAVGADAPAAGATADVDGAEEGTEVPVFDAAGTADAGAGFTAAAFFFAPPLGPVGFPPMV